MCYAFCKEFKGWCKSFTRIELCLCALEAVLLLVLIGFLTFLTLHLLACPEKNVAIDDKKHSTNIKISTHASENNLPFGFKKYSTVVFENTNQIATSATTRSLISTLPPNVECTWEPSEKTKATKHYYFTGTIALKLHSETAPTEATIGKQSFDTTNELENSSMYGDDMNPDGDDAPSKYKDYVAVLVKSKPPADVIFGCILTKITMYWALTAASCIEAVEEVDSLDYFFIMDSLGELVPGRSHAVSDVQFHPLYQGTNHSYDLAGLRSEDALAPNTAHLLKLATVVEYFLVGIGERFTILGYGGYRTIEVGGSGRRLRHVSTFTLSMSQCGDGADAWAPRHLSRGSALVAGTCGTGACGPPALCAGALYSRGTPCAYCAGTPLLRASTLYGVMSENRQCGVACEPVLYVNVAALHDWIHSIVIY